MIASSGQQLTLGAECHGAQGGRVSWDDAHIASVVLDDLHVPRGTSRKGSELGGHADHAQHVVCGLVNRKTIQLLGLPGLVPGIDLDTILNDDNNLVSGETHSANRSLGGDEPYGLVLHSIPNDDLKCVA